MSKCWQSVPKLGQKGTHGDKEGGGTGTTEEGLRVSSKSIPGPPRSKSVLTCGVEYFREDKWLQ